MAPKRSSPLEDPPAASSSSEEEESEEENEEEEEEGDSEEESEEEQNHQKKKAFSPPPPTPPVEKKSSLKKPESQPVPSSSDDGSDSDSESDSDSDNNAPPRPLSSVPDPNVKPIASKPMDDASKTKKPRSKPSSTPTKSAVKRPSDNSGDGKDSKRAKKKVADVADGGVEAEEKKSGEDAKKQLFQRLWSEEDELDLLKGMIEYTSKKGMDPSADMIAFHDFIKKSLHVDVTKTQLVDKVRRLKKKYENNLGKGKKGEDRTFSKPHEQKAYELSKKIWGGEVNNGGIDNSKANGKSRRSSQKSSKSLTPVEKEQLLSSLRSPKETSKKEIEQNSGPSCCVSESIRFSKSFGGTGLDEEVIKQGLDLIAGAKKSELEEKWRKLQMAEMELFLRRVELIREQTKLILDTYKTSEH